ncbi:PQQ-like domain-containing protein [Nocardioides sp. YR527]|uniref:outer membrane protein assembly factor BamB family protein n=1 Tax=Nocardioides sp. YR527 TaxID=1881028 RepID=UPI00088D831F|nr:PQQ-binding-like beta-propeller repeat protein [Nocardioides sp. YR527]SDL34432.1 PQQ-like domain-containing protein [Nocardioides sp. YR527]
MSDRSEISERAALTSLEGGQEPFDPEQVPMFPLVRAQIRQTDEGELEGLVDDVSVGRNVELEPVRRSVVEAAAKAAAQKKGPMQTRAIRVRGISPDDSIFHLVVTASGEVYETTDPTTRTSTGTASRSRAGRRQPTGSAPSTAPRPARQRPAGMFFLIIGLMVVLLLAFLGTPIMLMILRAQADDDGDRKPVPPKPVQLPVVAPAPYEAVARWSIPLGTSSYSSTSAPVTADGDRVYVVRDGGETVAAYDAETGVPGWKNPNLDGTVTAGPVLADVDGEQVLTVATSSDLMLLDPSTGKPVGEWELGEAGAEVRMTPTGPIVLDDAGHARMVSDGDLVTRVIPATGTAVAPTVDGGLIVVGAAGEVWTVTDTRVAPAPQSLVPPAGTAFSAIAGWSGSRLVLAYHATTDTGSNQVRLAGYTYTTSGWRLGWTTGSIPTVYATGQEMPLASSATGTWGIYGSTSLDLETGTVAALPTDWATSAVGDERAFGTGAGKPLAAAPSGVLAESLEAPAPPLTSALTPPQASAGTAAYVVASADSSTAVLYALRLPKDTSAETTPGASTGMTTPLSSPASALNNAGGA